MVDILDTQRPCLAKTLDRASAASLVPLLAVELSLLLAEVPRSSAEVSLLAAVAVLVVGLVAAVVGEALAALPFLLLVLLCLHPNPSPASPLPSTPQLPKLLLHCSPRSSFLLVLRARPCMLLSRSAHTRTRTLFPAAAPPTLDLVTSPATPSTILVAMTEVPDCSLPLLSALAAPSSSLVAPSPKPPLPLYSRFLIQVPSLVPP